MNPDERHRLTQKESMGRARDLPPSFTKVGRVLNGAMLEGQGNTMRIVLIDCHLLCDDMLANSFVKVPTNKAVGESGLIL